MKLTDTRLAAIPAKITDIKLTEHPEETDEGPRVEELVGDVGDVSESSRFQQYVRRIDESVLAPARIAWADWRTRFGIVVLAFYTFMVVIWADMYEQTYMNAAPSFIKPFDWSYTQEVFGITVWKYPLGTTDVGRPILQRLVNAAPDMAELVIAGAVVSIFLAVVVGTTAGFKGGFVDDVLMGITDIVLTIPGLPLVLLLAAVFQPKSTFVIGMILAIDNWPGLARTLRSQVFTIREESYVEASRTMGVPTGNILRKDIIPQLMPYVLVNAAAAGKRVINEAVALYFLGFIPTSEPNWGRMLNEAYQAGAITNSSLFYMILWPMLIISLLSFALVMLAQGLDQIFNPRLRARHSHHVGEDEEDAIDPSNT